VVNVVSDIVNETLGGSGSDTVNVAFTALGTYVMTLGVENAFISTGTAGVNITGSADNNLITGNTAANLLNGAGGNDTLDGGTGNDTLDGGLGDDRVVLAGSIGEWIVTRPTATDTMLTRTGQTVTIRAVELVQFDDALVDMVALWHNAPTPFNDVLTGFELDDLIDGLAGNDTITGMDGSDTLTGGLGIDSLIGGAGNDVYVVDVLGDQIVENAGEGFDTVNVALTLAGAYVMGQSVENGTVTAGGTLAVGIVGNALDNVLTGNANANALTGADGNDTLVGNAGNDTLNGGAGNDSLDGGIGTDALAGGAGDDTYIINLTTDVVTEGLTAGTDTVNLVFAAAATYTMTLNVENANVANGTSGVNITGNVLANVLNGNAGNNTLVGGDGNDTIAGNAGTDVVDGGLGTADVLVLSGSAEDYLITRPTLAQTVFSRAGVQVTVSNVEFVQFDAGGPQAYSSVVAQTGSPGNDVLTGFAGDETLDGAAGNDSVSGLGGDDTLFGGAGNDTILGGAGTDILDGGAGVDTYVYAQGDGDDLIDQNDTVAGVIDMLVLSQTGLAAGQVTFTRGYQTYNDLVVNITQADETVDHVAIVGFFSNDAVSLGTIDQVQVVIDGLLHVYTQAMLAAEALLDGDGDHIFVGYNSADTVAGSVAGDWIATGNGNDIVNADDGDDIAFGGGGADQLNGGDGADLLAGGAGADTMAGGTGNDTLSGGAGGDLYRIEAGGDDDVISESLPSLTDEQLQSGIGPIYVVGDGDAPLATDTDTLSFLAGIAEADVRATRSGNDLVFTIAGADTVTVANYFANGVATIERVLFASGASWSSTAIRAKVLVPTSGDDEVTGYLGGDRLNGLAGDDTLDGREGGDILTGGDGNDVLTGGSGSDRFVFNVAPDEATNLDTIIDFQSGVDTIVLSAGVFTAFSGLVGTRVGLSDNLTYDNGTGALAYDQDGAGAAAAVTIAIIGAGLHPASLGTDFVIGV
jgi:Ca2+-binding RTX toxin-like protein